MKTRMNWKSVSREVVISLFIVFSITGTYAALSSLTATTGESLTATKWNNLVDHATPSGAVMAFDLAACPTWWTEYTLAYGRFIRWVDKSGSNIDPDGQRALGNIQTDALQNFTGSFTPYVSVSSVNGVFSPTGIWGGGSANSPNGYTRIDFDVSTVARTSIETRPLNISLLYCKKD